MGYKYEVHMHTFEASACGKTPGREYIQAFIDHGYDGMIITDHFYHGNTRPDRSLPWADYVNEFCRGYEAAKAEGDKLGFKVFFGWEENFHGDEYGIYGLDKQWLLDHPEYKDADQAQQLEMVHAAGGAVVQFHPFRARGYLSSIHLHPFQCDAMEVCNFGNPPQQDVLAYNYCKKLGKPMTSGTDLHDKAVLDATVAGMVFDQPLTSSRDYARAILAGQGFTALTTEERKTMTPEVKNELPIILWDSSNKGREVTLEELA